MRARAAGDGRILRAASRPRLANTQLHSWSGEVRHVPCISSPPAPPRLMPSYAGAGIEEGRLGDSWAARGKGHAGQPWESWVRAATAYVLTYRRALSLRLRHVPSPARPHARPPRVTTTQGSAGVSPPSGASGQGPFHRHHAALAQAQLLLQQARHLGHPADTLAERVERVQPLEAARRGEPAGRAISAAPLGRRTDDRRPRATSPRTCCPAA